MMLLKFLNFCKKCNHEKITPDMDTAYCPDCGKLIKNEWYITRCSCCGVKLESCSKNGMILPQKTFCTNCGHKDYIVEKIKKINFIDLKYAVLTKRVLEENIICSTTRCWQEKSNEKPKLLTQYL